MVHFCPRIPLPYLLAPPLAALPCCKWYLDRCQYATTRSARRASAEPQERESRIRIRTGLDPVVSTARPLSTCALSVDLTGCTARHLNMVYTDVLADIATRLGNGTLRPKVAKVFPLEKVREAHRISEMTRVGRVRTLVSYCASLAGGSTDRTLRSLVRNA